MIAAALIDVVRYGDPLALRAHGDPTHVPPRDGLYLCANDGGPAVEEQPFRLTGRTDVGGWETWTVERGED